MKGYASMKMRLTQLIAVLTAIFMVLTLMGGCTGGNVSQSSGSSLESSATTKSSDTGKPSESSTQEPDGWEAISAKVDIPEVFHKDPAHLEWMDDTSPVSISIYYNTLVSDKEFEFNTIVEQKITELTGVTIDGIYDTTADGSNLTLMIASGDPLPDVITNLGTGTVHYRDLVDGDALYPINELISQYCPLMNDLLEDYAKGIATDEDGNMWYLPKGVTTGTASDYFGTNGWVAVRGDVCEALSIEPLSIKTLADMENVLELWSASKDQWPEIKYPIYFQGLTNNAGNGRPFYNSFGGQLDFNLGLDMIYDKTEDSVHFWIEDDYGYKAVKYMWSLAQKGYVDESSFAFTNTYDELCAGSTLIACGENMWQATMCQGTLSENVPGAYYTRTGMLAAEEGMDVCWNDTMYSSWGNGVVVTKDCVNPERTIKFLEFMQSEYASILIFCGIYGEDWDGFNEDENGGKYIRYIGESVTEEGRSARGIYNYNIDLLNSSCNYDYFASSTGGDKEVENAGQYVKFDLISCAPLKVMNSVPADSEYAVLCGSLMPIIGTYQTQMILARDEAAFDATYADCLEALESSGLERFKAFILGLTKEHIAQMESYGVVYQ